MDLIFDRSVSKYMSLQQFGFISPAGILHDILTPNISDLFREDDDG